MRRAVFAVVVVAALAAATPARAADVTLWGCHGPYGGGLPFGYTAAGSFETTIVPTDGGCSAPGGAIRLAFTRPDPGESHAATLRFAAPAGVTLARVWIGRRATGPGYWARTSSTPLEAEDGHASRDGILEAAADGQYVEVGLGCATAPRCDAAGAGVDFRFAALTVRDVTDPTLTVTGVPATAGGQIAVGVDARDIGLGVANIVATLDGRAVATSHLGQGLCDELSPADTTTDLPLAESCPAAQRVTLPVDTTTVADGRHRLELAVADGAGNTTVRGVDFRIVNHPGTIPPVLPPPTRPVAVAPTPESTPVPSKGVIKVPSRVTVSRRGTLTFDVSCPAASPAACPLRLKLTAVLPGRRKAATIASGRGTAKPGASKRITLKLSSPARAALARRRTLSARITLAGAAAVPVKLQR